MDQVSAGLGRRDQCVQLREVNGFDEQLSHGTDTASAINLLDRLLIRRPGSVSEDFSAIELTASERDRLLARVYAQTFGSRIESTAHCTQCARRFDLAFTIEELLDAFEPATSLSAVRPEADGTFWSTDGFHFRLPTGEDELATSEAPLPHREELLLRRCLIDSKAEIDAGALQQAMSEVAPLLDIEMDVRCPECDASQTVRFDIQFYLMQALGQQRKNVAREVHRLASTYGWSLTEILGLARSQRRALVELIEEEFS